MKRAAANLGVGITDVEKSAFQIVDEIYDKKIAYSETRLLYIGLFSKSPNNVFASNYTELLYDLVTQLYGQPSYEEEVFDALFQLQYASRGALEETKSVFSNPEYATYFDRLYSDDSLAYRCYISILALCGALKTNIAERKANVVDEVKRTREFLSAARVLLSGDTPMFRSFFGISVKMWMQDMLGADEDPQVRRDMYIRTKASNFTNMYRKLLMEWDLEQKRH